MRLIAAFLGAAVMAWFLSHIALRIGWVDQRSGQEYRKLRRHPVALVGGAVILIAVLLAISLAAIDSQAPLASFAEDLRGIAWPGLLGAFVLGLLDDVVPGGLSALVKFAGQLLVAALVASFPGSVFADASAMECVGLGALALVAMNAVNLFDHADGLVGILGATAMVAGKAPLAPLFAAATAGYLPFNLFFRRRADATPMDVGEERIHSSPFAMLGDSGSHLLGVLLATTPGAWWFLALPVLDMLRVVGKRLSEGRRFWRGDRTHLGHLLQSIGFSPVTTALLVGTLLLPPLATVTLMDGPAPLFSGLLATAALYFGMLVMADHAVGERGFDPLGEVGLGDLEPGEIFPVGSSEPPLAGPSVSSVFTRASGVESDDVGEAPRGLIRGRKQPPGKPLSGPPAPQDGPSGPFADPSSVDADS